MKIAISDANGSVRLAITYDHDYGSRSSTHVVLVPITGSRDEAISTAVERLMNWNNTPADDHSLAVELHGDLATTTKEPTT